MLHTSYIAKKLQLSEKAVQAVIDLLEQDATIPFIARYRKEATGSLDEVAITAIRDTLHSVTELEKRRDAILRSLAERELLSPELESQIREADTLARLEDSYLPFRPKRRTRAAQARERQLEPLALWLLEQKNMQPETQAQPYIKPELGVTDADAALAGARDIIAEMFAEDSHVRPKARDFFAHGLMSSKVMNGKEDEGEKYRDYFAWSEPVQKAPAHRILALFRGETENMLRVDIQPASEENCRHSLESYFVRNDSLCAQQVRLACQDGYTRLLAPAMETEIRNQLKERADTESIRVFAENLRQLLLAAPLGAQRILAIDPGFRTGCKFVCLDAQGQLGAHATINPHAGSAQMKKQAEEMLLQALQQNAIEAIAIGNGTAGRETEAFVRALLVDAQKRAASEIPVIMVSENGASVYSASEIAREEFPTLDLTYRGAISIGRRLADPLAELVKIDPKSIGVGQYQHDVNQTALRSSLDDVVRSCVNAVGVNVNTASEQLLTYVSGLNSTLARNIIAFRKENGSFASRAALRKVPRLGPKAFEQCAGFLRIPDAKNPLDASAVHPEAYAIVEKMARDYHCTVKELMQEPEKRHAISCERYVSDTIGLPTLTDIMQELEKPGRDPRQPFTIFSFQEGIHELSDLREGMRLPGIVTNITAFGAFVDIGVHQDGLVHISQLADRFVKDPGEVVRVHQEVMVTVTAVDSARKRIALSMRG